MLLIHANRHFAASIGVSRVLPNMSGPYPRQLGKGRAPEARQKFIYGVGNEHLDQIIGRPAALP
jgi:hypothetical protein